MIAFEITYEDLVEAVEHSRKSFLIDNLRDRSPFVQFDSKIRGYLGEICFVRWLKENNIDVVSVDTQIETNNEDIDILVNNNFVENIIIEVKTSLVPDVWKTMEEVVEKADIKIIKREISPLFIKADFYVQIYFNFFRKERDLYLTSLDGFPDDYTNEELIEIMKLKKLKECFVAWMDFNSLNNNLDKTHSKYWSFGKRVFWKCPLKTSFSPDTFIPSLLKYTGKKIKPSK